MKYFVTINEKKYEVEVEKAAESEGSAKSTGTKVIQAPANAAEKNMDASSSKPIGGDEKILAPMPGTILSVKVNEGQKVKKGEVLLVLEAMKMENEIMNPHDSIVSKILVSSGTAVKTGDILILLK